MKNLLSILSLLMSFSCFAQIQVGPREIAAMNNPGSFADEDIVKLKETTTIFVLQDKDYQNLEAWETAIKSVWSITPFKIITRNELPKYSTGNYSLFTFGGFVLERRSSGGVISTNEYFTYDLWMQSRKKNGDVKGQDYFARILIYPDDPTGIIPNPGSFQSRKINNKIYDKTEIYNWSPSMLKGYLKTVNDRLLVGGSRGPFTEEENKNELRALKTDTLFIPEYIAMAENRSDKNGLQDSYPFPVRIVSREELEQIISASLKPVYYLTMVLNSPNKYINVFEAKSGNLLFARHASMSYAFRYKDLKDLYKTIN